MKKIIAFVAAAAVASGLVAQPATAQERQSSLPNPRGMVANFDVQNLGPVLTELGVTWQARNVNGRTVIDASLANEFYFTVVPLACSNTAATTGCVGAQIIAFFDDVTPNAQTIAAVNQSYVFTTVGAASSTSAFISRYEIADFGIARGNVASSVGSFVGLAIRFWQEISAGSQTISQEGRADDLSANYLNRVSAQALGVPMADDGTLADMHQRSLEEFPAILRDLSASDAPKNRGDGVISAKLKN